MENELHEYEQELLRNTQKYKSICLEYADAKQVYQRMEDLKKSKLAQLKSKYEGSEAKLERQALADDEYIRYLDEVSSVRKAFYEADAVRDAYKNRIDAIITLISLEKEKLKLR